MFIYLVLDKNIAVTKKLYLLGVFYLYKKDTEVLIISLITSYNACCGNNSEWIKDKGYFKNLI
jgi:hypothetical protein